MIKRKPITAALGLAVRMAAAGISMVPVGADKRPYIKWKERQAEITPAEQLEREAGDGRCTGFAAIGGQVSGNLEILDIDVKAFYPRLLDLVPWAADLPTQRTGGGGYQIMYRRDDAVPGNTKLAWAPDETEESGRTIAVETRGEGGYALIPGSRHPSGGEYEMLRGEFTDLPTITGEQAEQLHAAARSLCLAPEAKRKAKALRQAAEQRSAALENAGPGSRPAFDQATPGFSGDQAEVITQYKAHHSITDALVRYGYTYLHGDRWARPGGTNESVTVLGERSYHHNSNEDLADGKAHDSFDLFCEHEHDGDFKAAVRAAARMLGLNAPPRPRAAMRIARRDQGAADEGGPARNLRLAPGDDEGRDDRIYAGPDGYYRDVPVIKKGEANDAKAVPLTNWLWEADARLAYPDGGVGERGQLVIGRRRVETLIPATAWASRQKLTDEVGKFGALVFASSNTEVAQLGNTLALANDQLPTAFGVLSYGMHEHDGQRIELYADGTLGDVEFEPLFYAGVEVSEASKAFAAPRLGTPEQVDQARQAIIDLPHMVTPSTALALLGYAAASAFAPRITPGLGQRLPFLYNAGERESGKTSAAQIALELSTGHSSRITKVQGLTPYQYDRMFGNCNNLLAVLDEYRPTASPHVDTQMRKHHDLDVKTRGQGSKAADAAYLLNAPMIVSGEGFSEDAATMSRGALYFTSKKDRGPVERYGELTRLPLWAYSGHLHQLARDTPDEVVAARLALAETFAREPLAGRANPRLQYALTFIAFGLLTLREDVSEALFSDNNIAHCMYAGTDNTLQGADEGVSNLELWLGQLGYCLTKVPDPTPFVVPGAVPNTVIIKRAAVQMVADRLGREPAIGNERLFSRFADEAPYFTPGSGDQHKTHDGRNVRGKRLDLAAVPDRADVDELISLNARLRGAGIAGSTGSATGSGW